MSTLGTKSNPPTAVSWIQTAPGQRALEHYQQIYREWLPPRSVTFACTRQSCSAYATRICLGCGISYFCSVRCMELCHVQWCHTSSGLWVQRRPACRKHAQRWNPDAKLTSRVLVDPICQPDWTQLHACAVPGCDLPLELRCWKDGAGFCGAGHHIQLHQPRDHRGTHASLGACIFSAQPWRDMLVASGEAGQWLRDKDGEVILGKNKTKKQATASVETMRVEPVDELVAHMPIPNEPVAPPTRRRQHTFTLQNLDFSARRLVEACKSGLTPLSPRRRAASSTGSLLRSSSLSGIDTPVPIMSLPVHFDNEYSRGTQ